LLGCSFASKISFRRKAEMLRQKLFNHTFYCGGFETGQVANAHLPGTCNRNTITRPTLKLERMKLREKRTLTRFSGW
jgi:hypothetical protein